MAVAPTYTVPRAVDKAATLLTAVAAGTKVNEIVKLKANRAALKAGTGTNGSAQDIGAATGTITLSGVAGAITPAGGPTIGAATGPSPPFHPETIGVSQ